MKHILFLLLVLLASPVYATTYYVNKAGSDANSCVTAQSATDANAKLTIAAGLGCLAAGDTLIVGSGTYAENVTAFVSGTSVNVVTTVKSESLHGAIIQPASGTNSVSFNNKRFIIFDGFVVDGTNTTSHGIRTFGLLGTADIILQNLEVKNIGGTESDASGTCIITDHAARIQILNSLLHDCGANDSDGHSHGIYMSGSNSLAEHNEIYNINGHGIHQFLTAGGSSNNIVRHNYVHDTTSRCILIGSGANNLAHNNIVRDCAAASGAMAAGFSSATNTQIYNNTIYSGSGSCIEVRSTSTGALVKNNWCLSNSNNTVLNSGTSTTGACGTFGNVCNTTTTNAVDVATNRFSPREGAGVTSLVDTGVTFTTTQYSTTGKFVGAAPDVGALEAPIFLSASVEDGDASTVRIKFSQPTQNVIDGVGFGNCGSSSLTYYAAIFNGVANTETACSIPASDTIYLTVGTPMANGDTPNTIAYTRGATYALRGNSCVGFKSASTCLQPEVRTFAAQNITNNVGAAPAGATVALVKYQCMDIYGTTAAPNLRGTVNAACQVATGGYFALVVWVQATGADPASITFETQFDKNSAASWAYLTDTPVTNQISFGQHAATTLVDGENIDVDVGTLNPQATLIDGKVVGRQISAPTADLEQNSAVPVIILGRIAGATAGRSCGGDYFDLKLVIQGGTDLDAYTVTPRICVRPAQSSIF
jgi:hypothetical protein